MRYDLIIVGAGPAGSSAAYHAAKAGLNTLIVDQSLFPRDKACAGGLTMAAKKYLPEDLPEAIIQTRIHKLRTFLDSESSLHTSKQPFMEIVNRHDFDTWMLSLAVQQGAFPLLGVRVYGCQSSRDGIQLRTSRGEIEGRLLIAADGANSIIARQTPGNKRPIMGYCLQAEIQGQPADTDTITIHYGLVPEGYGWVFPRRQNAVAGVGGVLAKLPDPKRRLLTLLQRHGLSMDGAHIQAHTIPIGGPNPLLMDKGILFVGDAAGLVDPFTGEGIRYSLLSGRRAAETAAAALSQRLAPTRELLIPYVKSCQREIMPQLRSAYGLSRAFFGFARWVEPRLFGRDEPIEQLLDVLRGRISYQRFLYWGIMNLPGFILPPSHSTEV